VKPTRGAPPLLLSLKVWKWYPLTVRQEEGRTKSDARATRPLGGNFFAGASELLVGPDRAKGGVGATKDAAIHASPKVLTQTVGQIATRMGTTIYAVPGTEVEIGGQTRWATMWERYVAQRVKDLPAFKAAMGGLEDALDGKLLLDGGTYLSMELSCVIGN